MPINDTPASLDVFLDRIQELDERAFGQLAGHSISQQISIEQSSYLVFVDDPALELITPSFMTLLVLDHLVHRHMSKTRALRQYFTMRCFTNAGCSRHNDVG